MSPRSHIVAGGGYSEREFTGRPKFRLFCFIALLWLPVAFCASLPLWTGLSEDFAELRWLCWVLSSVEPVFIVLALFFRFAEQPRRVVEHHVQ